MEVVGCSDKISLVYQFLNDSNDSAKRVVLDVAALKEGLVCLDPAPKIAEAHETGLISTVKTTLRDLLLLRWW